MLNTREYQPEQHQRYLFLGRSGSGKSIAAAGWKGVDAKKYLFSLDGRISNLAKYDIDYDIYRSFQEMDKKIEELQRSCPYAVVMVCGISGLCDALISEAIKLLGFTAARKEQKRHTIGKVSLPDFEHWNYQSEAIRQLCYNGLFTLPCDIILEGHLVNAYDVKGNVSGERLLSTDKLAEKIPGYFDEVWTFEKVSISPTTGDEYFVNFKGGRARTSSTFTAAQPARLNITGRSLCRVLNE